MKRLRRGMIDLFIVLVGSTLLLSTAVQVPRVSAAPTPANQVLEWNQIFTDTLIATNTPNSSSQRLGAIVHTAIFDAYNGIEQRYTPMFVEPAAPQEASPEAAAIGAAYNVLVDLFPAQQSELDPEYAASLETLSESCSCPERMKLGIDWGTEVGRAVLAWRATDEFSASYPAFTGGIAVGQWRPTLPASGPMSAQGLAFTSMFVLTSNSQFRPAPPRALDSATYAADFNADGNPNTTSDFSWLPLVNTPSHPEYPAGHPGQNGAAAAVLLNQFSHDAQTFTLTTTGQPDRTYSSIANARADGNNARIWGGMHYPSTIEISDAMGATIADYVNRNAMRPLRPGNDR